MSKETPDTIHIKEIGHFGEYIVQSHSSPTPHTVNLCERAGSGVCTCEYWRFTASKNYRTQFDEARARGEEKPRPFVAYRKGRAGCTECKHIFYAREHFTKFRLRQLFATYGNHPTPEEFAESLRALMQWPRRGKKN